MPAVEEEKSNISSKVDAHNDENNNDTDSNDNISLASTTSSSGKSQVAEKKIQPASFAALFRFASTRDRLVFAVGFLLCVAAAGTLPGMNIIFGDMIDAVAKPISTKELVTTSTIAMAILGVYGFITFFCSFFACGWVAARIANGFRTQFLEAVLRQDAAFFDNVEPGALSLLLSDSAIDIQAGLADKFAQAIQGLFQLLFGFALAFYFGPLLTLILLACLPLMIGITTALVTWGSDDGIYGKVAYEHAASIASETLCNIRTVFSLNAEVKMSQKYDAKLGECERAAVREAARASFLTGLLFFVMFCMYGLGFWYGAKIIADSSDHAIEEHPPPEDLFNPSPDSPWLFHYAILSDETVCGEYISDDDGTIINQDALEICACGLPWSIIELESPECGCGFYEAKNTGLDILAGCFSGGTTILVFFSILIGGFGAGQIGPGIKALGTAQVAAARMLQVIERVPDVDITQVHGKTRLRRSKVKGEIVLEDMHFRYNGSDSCSGNTNNGETNGNATKDKGKSGSSSGVARLNNTAQSNEVVEGRLVFGGCNLIMKPGETVALVGESGCGKSTIAKLIQRFYDPTAGRILLDGVDLRDIALVDLRANIGVVSQEPLLFDTSIRENIRYGKTNATEEEIMQAAKSANAHDFISRFPDGYETSVGPRGCKLSGGQKQRVAIARAILRNPPILILDEATSALDNRSEKIVQKALDKLVESNDRQRTTIVIAHRLSTVRNADRIVVLGSPEGTSTAATGSIILEQGSHEELMAKGRGYYRALVGAGRRGGGATSVVISDGKEGEVGEEVTLEEEGGEEDSAFIYDSKTSFNTPINDNEEQKEEEEQQQQGLLSNLFGGDKKKKDLEDVEKAKKEKEQTKQNNSRVWHYTKPELGWIIFGSMASACKGTIFPLISVVFAEMIAVWYDNDTDRLRDQSLQWSFLFYALALLSLIFETTQKVVFEMIGERLTKRLRGDLFRSMLRQDITWFEDEANAMGVLASRLSTDVKLVRLVAGQSLAATLESIASLVTGIIIAAFASWEVFLIMLSMVPLLGVTEALQWVAIKGSEGGIREELSKSIDRLQETINGIREVQAFSLERVVEAELESRINDTIVPASRRAALMKGLMMGMVQLIQFGVYGFAFWFGGLMIDKGRIEFDQFMRALWAMAFAASGLGTAAVFAGDAAKAAAAVKSVFETLDQRPVIDSMPWENDGCMDFKTEKPTVRELKDEEMLEGTGNAELTKVNFAYPTRKTAKIFDGIDLVLPAGKVVALVGSSGSGKSTVVQLLERFYDPITYIEEEGEGGKVNIVIHGGGGSQDDSNGFVKVDGKDLRVSDCRLLRKHMGLVGQEPVLFNDTIYNNIALGKEGCNRDEVEEAARSANAYEFIMKLENGFDTVVGRGGSKVSGGQKQRIAIARALVSNPKILLLDEATSALDNESEKVVQASLDTLVKERGGDRTTIIIAHRLSTIKEADVICVLENKGEGSKVCEIGTHDELMALGQKYMALVQAYNH